MSRAPRLSKGCLCVTESPPAPFLPSSLAPPPSRSPLVFRGFPGAWTPCQGLGTKWARRCLRPYRAPGWGGEDRPRRKSGPGAGPGGHGRGCRSKDTGFRDAANSPPGCQAHQVESCPSLQWPGVGWGRVLPLSEKTLGPPGPHAHLHLRHGLPRVQASRGALCDSSAPPWRGSCEPTPLGKPGRDPFRSSFRAHLCASASSLHCPRGGPGSPDRLRAAAAPPDPAALALRRPSAPLFRGRCASPSPGPHGSASERSPRTCL